MLERNHNSTGYHCSSIAPYACTVAGTAACTLTASAGSSQIGSDFLPARFLCQASIMPPSSPLLECVSDTAPDMTLDLALKTLLGRRQDLVDSASVSASV